MDRTAAAALLQRLQAAQAQVLRREAPDTARS